MPNVRRMGCRPLAPIHCKTGLSLAPGLLERAGVFSPVERIHVSDDFDREVNEWFDELEEQLAPAGRQTAHDEHEDDEDAVEALRPILSHPSTLAPPRPVLSAAREEPPSSPIFESGPEPMGLARREAELRAQKHELVRVEALVDVIRELVAEMRSIRRDVDQIKAVIGKVRQLVEVQRRGMA